MQFVELCDKAELTDLAAPGMPLLMEAGKKVKAILPAEGPCTKEIDGVNHVLTTFGNHFINLDIPLITESM